MKWYWIWKLKMLPLYLSTVYHDANYNKYYNNYNMYNNTIGIAHLNTFSWARKGLHRRHIGHISVFFPIHREHFTKSLYKALYRRGLMNPKGLCTFIGNFPKPLWSPHVLCGVLAKVLHEEDFTKLPWRFHEASSGSWIFFCYTDVLDVKWCIHINIIYALVHIYSVVFMHT